MKLYWTEERPTSPGWYWVRGAYSNDIILEARRIDTGELSMDDGVQDLLLCEGLRFAGPIATLENKADQVAVAGEKPVGARSKEGIRRREGTIARMVLVQRRPLDEAASTVGVSKQVALKWLLRWCGSNFDSSLCAQARGDFFHRLDALPRERRIEFLVEHAHLFFPDDVEPTSATRSP